MPVDEEVLDTDVGFNVKPLRTAGLIVNDALAFAPTELAVIVTVAVVETAVVLTTNVAVDEPAGINAVAGGIAAALFDTNPIVTPPCPAGEGNVMVPVELLVPNTEVGLSVRAIDAGLTTKLAEHVTPAIVALRVTVSD